MLSKSGTSRNHEALKQRKDGVWDMRVWVWVCRGAGVQECGVCGVRCGVCTVCEMWGGVCGV